MATIVTAQDGLASATSTWVGGVVPVEDDSVEIRHECTIDSVYNWGDDTNRGVVVFTGGTLKASRSVTSNLTVKGDLRVEGTGSFDYGTQADPIPLTVSATINLNNSDTLASGKWGMWTDGDTNISFQGADKTTNTQTTAVAALGSTTLEVEDATGWMVGDNLILMSPTPLRTGQERVVISGVSGNTITLSSALTQVHPQGQYLSNMSKSVVVKATDENFVTFVQLSIHTLSARIKNIVQTEFNHISYVSGSTRAGLGFTAFGSTTQDAVNSFRDCTFTDFNGDYGVDFFSIGSRVVASNLAFDVEGNGVTIRQGSTCTIEDSLFHRTEIAVLSGFSQGGVNPVFNRCVFSGSLQCISIGTGNSFLIRDCEFRSSDNGFTLGFGSAHRVIDSVFGPTGTELLRPFLVNNNAVSEVLCTDCLFGTSTNFIANIENASESAAIMISNRDRNPRNQETHRRVGSLFRDNTIARTSAPSARIDLNDDSAPFTFTLDIFAPTNTPVVVSGYIRKSSAYGSTNLPTATLSGLGITPSSFTIQDIDDVFQQFTVSGTQTSGVDGVLTLTFSAQSDDGSVWIDDVVAPVANPVNVGDFSFWQNGQPLQAVLANFVSSQDVWNAQTSEFTLPGSVGMEWSALRSLINDRVDEVISSRASSTEVAAVTTSLTAAIDALNNISVADVVTGVVTEVESSSVVAKEATVASRASQTSIDSLSTTVSTLPTSAFNSADRTALEALSNTSDTDIHTALDSYMNKGDYQADVSSLLQSADTRLDSLANLDTTVSSRSEFDASTDTVDARNMRGTDNALLAADYVAPTNPDLNTLTQDVVDIKNGLLGRWEIVGTQLIMYEADNTTVLRTFNLFDEAGQPTNMNILRREPV